MLSIIKSTAVLGIDAYIVDVELDLSNGLPSFDIVGLPDSAVKESKERVRTAIKNSGFVFPSKKITVNLAPADIKKEGPSFDLPIALAILAAMGEVKNSNLSRVAVTGELSLDGEIREVKGALSMAFSAKENNMGIFVLPKSNAKEAAMIDELRVVGVRNLKELVDLINGDIKIEDTKVDIESFEDNKKIYDLDFSDVKGQEILKRAFEIAAAGRHNLLIVGAPGTGKTMLCKRFPSILPKMTIEESVELTKIYSVSNLLGGKNLIRERPFRSPHHTISYSALTGGGRIPMPGEVSLAHNGVLFLDEMAEFSKKVLENLRQPLEDKELTISRVNASIKYPADFILIAAMNPCPCGFFGFSDKCRCSQNEISRYLSKISGPLLDRIDLQLEASAVKYEEINTKERGESSKEIRKRVERTRLIQAKRYENLDISFNSELRTREIEQFCVLGKEENELLKQGFESLSLSARAYHRVLKLSRTIADMEESEAIKSPHIIEALSYRNLDRAFYNY